ncbi:ABC transporter ATP-binding protein [Candidatus Saccharibacteria bacterium]|nr:MAG: ABC transporter ATP-binding protein [Candidatus Saccharibacteria bacterium]
MSTLVRLEDVSYSYGSHRALTEVSLDIEAGDYMGVIGPNGAGKSTLMRLILGLLRPTKGSITLWDEPIRSFRDWSKIGYVPQHTANAEYRLPITVQEVVQLGAIARGGKHTDALSALKQVGAESLASRQLAELSGGQQQKVYIAKALASRPELLILDEPTAGIDVQSQDNFYQLLSSLNHNGLTLLLVSHDIDVIVNEVNKLACINNSIVYHGKPQGFVGGDYLEQVYGKQRKMILHGH